MPPNTTTHTEDPHPRHVRLRGRRGFAGAGAANSTHSESLRTAAEEDEVDDLLEPEALRDHVLSVAQSRTPLPPPRMQALNTPDTQNDDDSGIADNPRDRLNQVAMGGSPAYTREYRLTLISRMLMRNIPLDQIAQQFQVSVSTIEKDRAEIKSRMRQRARDMDINEFIGQQSELYDEVSAMSMRVASSSNAPTPMKLAAMRTTLAANADRTRMLQSTGVMDVLRYRRAATEGELSDVQILMQRTMEMMDVLSVPPTPEPESEAPKKVRVKRTPRPAGGFKPFSMDDSDASNSTNETVEL